MAPHSSILALKNPTEDPDIVEAGRVVAPLASALTHQDRGAWKATETCKEWGTTKHTHNSNSNEVIVEMQD